MKRHIGKMVNTDQRLVVVFMQIPDRQDHALVIPTDTLPPRYEQAVMEILESSEGQNEETLANVLHRRLMPDTGKTVLQTLHDAALLKPIPIANIMMMPMPNMPFPLSMVLEGMGRSVSPSVPQPPPPLVHDMTAVEKYNQIAVNQKVEGIENRRAIAQNLLIEAQMLEGEAKKKRDRAYGIAPEMMPPKPEPVVSPVNSKFLEGATSVTDALSRLDAEASREKKSPVNPFVSPMNSKFLEGATSVTDAMSRLDAEVSKEKKSSVKPPVKKRNVSSKTVSA